MSAVLMEVVDVGPSESNSVALVENDNVIEELAPAATNPPLSHRILPGTAKGGSARSCGHRLDERDHVPAEDRVTVEDQMSRRRVEGECFSQLLDDSGGARVEGGVEVKDPSSVVVDDEPAVQDAQRGGWDRKEVHRGDAV